MKQALRIFLIFVTLFVTKGELFAALVSPSTAQTAAINFFNLNAKATNSRAVISATLKYTKTETDGTVDFYVFSISPAKGFVIVSADNQLQPVIAYSFESEFNTPGKNQGVLTWMNHAARHIYQAIQRHTVANSKISGQWTAYLQGINPGSAKSTGVAPLLTTTWNQEPYYNQLCPYNNVDSQQTLTGCVATAMAQIMKYWNYPAQGTGTYGYDNAPPYFLYNYGDQYANFGGTNYNWSGMPDSINSDNLSLATLMYHCGVAVATNYGDDNQGGSGAYVLSAEAASWQPCAQKAYVTYFAYNPNTITGVQEANYNSAAWVNLLESELSAGRPVQYEGTDTDEGGHTWVCDGYDANDFLHMNWGWGGLDNGFYSVSSLSADGYNFSSSEAALTGIEPMSDLTVTANAFDSAICGGGTTILNAQGSTNVNYLWTPATGLNCPTCATTTAGPDSTTTYTVIVDSAGFSASSQITVTVNNIAIDSFVLSNVTCYGMANGAAKVYVAGGNTGYSYLWSNGNDQAAVLNLAAATYTVTIGDASGCSTSASVTIKQPDSLHAVVSAYNAACSLSDAGLSVAVTGGTPAYTYKWNGGQQTPAISLSDTGIYTAIITDANGCSTASFVSVAQPVPINVNVVSSNTFCSLVYATVTANVTGGHENFSFSWNNGGTTSTITNLLAGTYAVTVTDSAGCFSSDSIFLAQPDSMNISITALNSADNTVYGKAVANVTGGKPQYSYLWNTGDTSETISYASAGVYTVTITDSKGCAQSSETQVTETTGIEETSNKITFQIYPNPISAQATILLSGANADNTTLEIKNQLGQTISASKITGTTNQLDFSGFSNGIYLVILTQGQYTAEKEVVVQK